MIIAIDGPTASGKGTISKELAKHFALPFLDTGLLYRAVGWTVRENGTDADNPADALAACNFDSALPHYAAKRLAGWRAAYLFIRKSALRFTSARSTLLTSRAALCWTGAT